MSEPKNDYELESTVQNRIDLSHAIHRLDQDIQRLSLLRKAAYAEYRRLEASA